MTDEINALQFLRMHTNITSQLQSRDQFSCILLFIFVTSTQMPLCDEIQMQSQMIHSQMASQHNPKNENKRYSFTWATNSGVASYIQNWRIMKACFRNISLIISKELLQNVPFWFTHFLFCILRYMCIYNCIKYHIYIYIYIYAYVYISFSI